MALLDDNAKGLIAMPLNLRADAEASFAKKCLKLFKANASEDRFLYGDFSGLEAQFLSQKDIDADFQVTVKPGSHIPRQTSEMQNEFMAALQALRTVGGPMMNLATPQILVELANVYNLPLPVIQEFLGARQAQRVLEEFKKLAPQAEAQMQMAAMLAMVAAQAGMPPLGPQAGMPVPPGGPGMMGGPPQPQAAAPQVGGQPDNEGGSGQPTQPPQGEGEAAGPSSSSAPPSQPGAPMGSAMAPPSPMDMAVEMILQQVPVRLWSDPHMQMASWFQSYANTDEGLNDSPLLQQLVNRRIEQHILAEGERGALTQVLQMQGTMMGSMGMGLSGPPTPAAPGGGPPSTGPVGGPSAGAPTAPSVSDQGGVSAMVNRLPLIAQRNNADPSGQGSK
jgi:hypothetical protein